MDLTTTQRMHLYWPLMYRLKAWDFFLPGLFAAAFVSLLSRMSFPPGVQQPVFFGSVFVLVLIINRAGFILAGRVGVCRKRLARNLGMLLELDGSLNMREFSVLTSVPLPEIQRALDLVMVEKIYMGYIDPLKMELNIRDEPTAGKKCPVCRGVLNEQVVLNKVCSFCGAVFYV